MSSVIVSAIKGAIQIELMPATSGMQKIAKAFSKCHD